MTIWQAFEDAGERAQSIADLLSRGVYFTTAIKCAKTGYAIQTGSIKQCSALLERELARDVRIPFLFTGRAKLLHRKDEA